MNLQNFKKCYYIASMKLKHQFFVACNKLSLTFSGMKEQCVPFALIIIASNKNYNKEGKKIYVSITYEHVGIMAQDSDFEEAAPSEAMKCQKTPSQGSPEADQTRSEQLEQSYFDDMWPPCTLLVQWRAERKPSIWVLAALPSKGVNFLIKGSQLQSNLRGSPDPCFSARSTCLISFLVCSCDFVCDSWNLAFGLADRPVLTLWTWDWIWLLCCTFLVKAKLPKQTSFLKTLFWFTFLLLFAVIYLTLSKMLFSPSNSVYVNLKPKIGQREGDMEESTICLKTKNGN